VLRWCQKPKQTTGVERREVLTGRQRAPATVLNLFRQTILPYFFGWVLDCSLLPFTPNVLSRRLTGQTLVATSRNKEGGMEDRAFPHRRTAFSKRPKPGPSPCPASGAWALSARVAFFALAVWACWDILTLADHLTPTAHFPPCCSLRRHPARVGQR